MLLFAQALENQHVGVHGRADGQDDSGDARQCKRGVEGAHGAENQHQVHQHGNEGDHPRDVVIGDQKHRHDDEPEAAGDEPAMEIVRPQRGAHLLFADRLV